MDGALKQFLSGLARRWWYVAATLISGLITFLGLYFPESVVLQSAVPLLPEFALWIFLIAFFLATFLTYKDLYDSLQTYDPTVGQRIHDLYVRGNELDDLSLRERDAQEWRKEVEALLGEHLPSELRLFQTIGDPPGPKKKGGLFRLPSTREKFSAQVRKLRLIMGRYESRRA